MILLSSWTCMRYLPLDIKQPTLNPSFSWYVMFLEVHEVKQTIIFGFCSYIYKSLFLWASSKSFCNLTYSMLSFLITCDIQGYKKWLEVGFFKSFHKLLSCLYPAGCHWMLSNQQSINITCWDSIIVFPW